MWCFYFYIKITNDLSPTPRAIWCLVLKLKIFFIEKKMCLMVLHSFKCTIFLFTVFTSSVFTFFSGTLFLKDYSRTDEKKKRLTRMG